MSWLEVDGVSVSFGGTKALQKVSLQADPGAITGLIGPNGAGKTTLFGVISGLIRPDEGTVRLAGCEVNQLKPHQRSSLGLGRTFQRLELYGSLTVWNNVRVAAEFARRWRRDIDPVQMADELIERLELTEVATATAATLPTGLARKLELGRALAAEPSVLLLDEPSSGLDHAESEQLGDLLVELADDGLGIILVEHHVELVTSICSWIYVLDFGKIIAGDTPTAIRANPDVQASYLGAATPAAAESTPEEEPVSARVTAPSRSEFETEAVPSTREYPQPVMPKSATQDPTHTRRKEPLRAETSAHHSRRRSTRTR